MVQRKQPKRIESQDDLSGNDTGSNTRRNMKKLSPTKEASDKRPLNYMKPTSNSGARKERLQVTENPPITSDKKRVTRNSSNSSKVASSSYPVSSGIEPAVKFLTTGCSLKPVRSSMKKSSGIGMYPRKNVSRATCSSTLKDAKFLGAVDLNQKMTKSQGASKMKACPYTRCSLHGHKHEPLPPLKCLLSETRKLVQNQKSNELKSPIAISKIPLELLFNPIFEETHDDDFFVQIYDNLSNEEMNALLDTLEFVEFDRKLETKQDLPIIVPMHHTVSGSQCNMTCILHKDSEEPCSAQAWTASQIYLDISQMTNFDISTSSPRMT